jgi:membrane-bound lytic murein transglycosylase MltF
MRLVLVRRLLAAAALAAGMLAGAALAQGHVATSPLPAAKPAGSARALAVANKEWRGDFDRMLARRIVRVYAPFSRSLYFNDRGSERGLAVEMARDWERYLNKKHAKALGKRPLTVYVAPATREKLLPYLDAGLADVSIGNLTITKARLEQADFVAGDSARRTLDEIVVTGPASPEVHDLADLSGKTVHVRQASSYHESLLALNDQFWREGKAPAEIVLVPEALEDEDMLDMLDAGLLQFIVVDDWKAQLWAPVLPRVKVREDLVLRRGGTTGWAIRKGSPKLEAEIADFFANGAAPGIVEHRLRNLSRRVKQLRDPTGSAEWKRFAETLAIFERFGSRYDFDPLMLAAQGWQESRLDQAARSHVGAIGVMQVMPATGADMGVGDIHRIEPNIHAGAKYMDLLMSRFFPDANFSPGNRPLFAFASYNCGPGNVAKARRAAAKRGLDPDKWFNNVEIVIAEQIGTETTTYVRNIYKYYVAYKLTLEAHEAAAKARREFDPQRR